jgi:hypothetical protein
MHYAQYLSVSERTRRGMTERPEAPQVYEAVSRFGGSPGQP